jgi:hypothetical protein
MAIVRIVGMVGVNRPTTWMRPTAGSVDGTGYGPSGCAAGRRASRLRIDGNRTGKCNRRCRKDDDKDFQVLHKRGPLRQGRLATPFYRKTSG